MLLQDFRQEIPVFIRVLAVKTERWAQIPRVFNSSEEKLMCLGCWEVKRGKIMSDSQVLAYGTRWFFTHVGDIAIPDLCEKT